MAIEQPSITTNPTPVKFTENRRPREERVSIDARPEPVLRALLQTKPAPKKKQ